jgi:hypothetical protein
MPRQAVESEAVNSIGYEAENQILAVEFREGRVYDYIKVPEETYRELMKADSIGNFVSTRIKPHFKFRRGATAGSPSSALRARSEARR